MRFCDELWEVGDRSVRIVGRSGGEKEKFASLFGQWASGGTPTSESGKYQRERARRANAAEKQKRGGRPAGNSRTGLF
jgi:hypothetical protein